MLVATLKTKQVQKSRRGLSPVEEIDEARDAQDEGASADKDASSNNVGQR